MSIVCLSNDALFIDKIVGLYGSANVTSLANIQALKKIDLEKCEVLVVDLVHSELPDYLTPQVPTIVLTAIPTFQEALVLLQRGAKGYGNRQMRLDNLSQAIESLKMGQIWLPPSIITQLISAAGTGHPAQTDSILEKLSIREQEVALHVAEGMSNQEMADKMFVSVRTIKAHLTAIYEKTGLRNRLELGLRLKK